MDLSLIQPEYVPPELLLDKYHPHNQEFFRQQQHLKASMVNKSLRMRPPHVQVAKMRAKGQNPKEIAQEIDRTPQYVSHVSQRQDVKELMALIHHLHALNEGPTAEHRARMLWELAVDAREDGDTANSKACLAELNKMAGSYHTKPDTATNITINNQYFPRGSLDDG